MAESDHEEVGGLVLDQISQRADIVRFEAAPPHFNLARKLASQNAMGVSVKTESCNVRYFDEICQMSMRVFLPSSIVRRPCVPTSTTSRFFYIMHPADVRSIKSCQTWHDTDVSLLPRFVNEAKSNVIRLQFATHSPAHIMTSQRRQAARMNMIMVCIDYTNTV